jgi:hypothetical protein
MSERHNTTPRRTRSRYLGKLAALYTSWSCQLVLSLDHVKRSLTLINIFDVLLVRLSGYIKHLVEVGADGVDPGRFDVLSFSFGRAGIVVQAFWRDELKNCSDRCL